MLHFKKESNKFYRYTILIISAVLVCHMFMTDAAPSLERRVPSMFRECPIHTNLLRANKIFRGVTLGGGRRKQVLLDATSNHLSSSDQGITSDNLRLKASSSTPYFKIDDDLWAAHITEDGSLPSMAPLKLCPQEPFDQTDMSVTQHLPLRRFTLHVVCRPGSSQVLVFMLTYAPECTAQRLCRAPHSFSVHFRWIDLRTQQSFFVRSPKGTVPDLEPEARIKLQVHVQAHWLLREVWVVLDGPLPHALESSLHLTLSLEHVQRPWPQREDDTIWDNMAVEELLHSRTVKHTPWLPYHITHDTFPPGWGSSVALDRNARVPLSPWTDWRNPTDYSETHPLQYRGFLLPGGKGNAVAAQLSSSLIFTRSVDAGVCHVEFALRVACYGSWESDATARPPPRTTTGDGGNQNSASETPASTARSRSSNTRDEGSADKIRPHCTFAVCVEIEDEMDAAHRERQCQLLSRIHFERTGIKNFTPLLISRKKTPSDSHEVPPFLPGQPQELDLSRPPVAQNNQDEDIEQGEGDDRSNVPHWEEVTHACWELPIIMSLSFSPRDKTRNTNQKSQVRVILVNSVDVAYVEPLSLHVYYASPSPNLDPEQTIETKTASNNTKEGKKNSPLRVGEMPHAPLKDFLSKSATTHTPQFPVWASILIGSCSATFLVILVLVIGIAVHRQRGQSSSQEVEISHVLGA